MPTDLADVLLITDTKSEFKAVLDAFRSGDQRARAVEVEGRTYIDLGTFGTARTFLMQADGGVEAFRSAIDALAPGCSHLDIESRRIRTFDQEILGLPTDQIYQWLMGTPPTGEAIDEMVEKADDSDEVAELLDMSPKVSAEAPFSCPVPPVETSITAPGFNVSRACLIVGIVDSD